MRKVLLAAAFILVCGVGQAQASLIVFGTVGGAPTGVTLDNLDWLTLGATGGTSGILTVSLSGNAQAVQGSVESEYAAPYMSGFNGVGFGNAVDGPDATTYITSGYSGDGSAAATVSFSSPQQYFGLLWGSIDAYNTLAFYNGANLIGSLTGLDILAGGSGGLGVNGTLYVNVNSDLAFNRVVATSSAPALEFDNLAFNATPVINVTPATVPEPASLLLVGVGLVGVVSRRLRRRN